MKQNTALKIGLIGYGRIARFFHLKTLADMQGVKLGALAETNSQKRLMNILLLNDYATPAVCTKLMNLALRADYDSEVGCGACRKDWRMK